MALDFPELTIVAGHIGCPWTTEMIALATKCPNVYIDTSAYTAKRYPPELVAYLREHGRQGAVGHQLSDAHRRAALGDLAMLDLDEETTGLFLAGNARRVFNLAPTR